MDNVLYGKRYKKPSKEELEEADKGYLEGSNNKHSFGFGTTATIHFDKHTQKYSYSIYELRNTWCDSSRFEVFDTIEEAKNHLVNNFGGKWRWRDKYIHKL